jgi:hypothetical protein
MIVSFEMSGRKIGTDNAITEAIRNKEFYIRMVVQDYERRSRMECTLSPEQFEEMLAKGQKTLKLYKNSVAELGWDRKEFGGTL